MTDQETCRILQDLHTLQHKLTELTYRVSNIELQLQQTLTFDQTLKPTQRRNNQK